MKAFLFNILLLDYDRHEGFLQPTKKLSMFWWYSRTAVCELCNYVSETREKAMKYFKNKWTFFGEIINNMLHASLSVQNDHDWKINYDWLNPQIKTASIKSSLYHTNSTLLECHVTHLIKKYLSPFSSFILKKVLKSTSEMFSVCISWMCYIQTFGVV